MLLCVVHCASLLASDETRTYTVTVGSKVQISPSNGTSTLYINKNSSYIISDANAFTITTQKHTNSYGSTTYTYDLYNLTALKAGTYTFETTISYRNTSSISSTWKNYTITHIITVVDVTSISIPSQVTLSLGDTYTYSPQIADNRAQTTLTWASGNPSVATVSNSVITTHSCGSAEITCTASNGVKATSTVTVNPVLVSGITLNTTECTIEENAQTQLTATITPSNATNAKVKWASTNELVALVSDEGLVTGVSAGICSIKATASDGSNTSASCLVHIVKPNVPAQSITLDKDEATLTIGETLALSANVLPSDATNSEVSWSSSDTDCATVDSKGVVTAKKIGKVTITATTTDGTNLSASCVVNIKSRDISEFDNAVYFEQTKAAVGMSLTLPLLLKNADAITALQFDLRLPDGITIETSSTGAYNVTFNTSAGRADESTHTLSCTKQSNGTIRVLCYSTGLSTFTGNSGAVLDIPVTLANDIVADDYNIILENIILSETSGEKHSIDCLSSTLNVVQCAIGDVNMDGEVDVADIVVTANYIMGDKTTVIFLDAADIDGDGIIDVADIVNLANLISNGETSQSSPRKFAVKNMQQRSESAIEITPFTITSGQSSKTLTLDLYNPGAEYTAFQCDLELPNGITIDKNRRGTAYNVSFNTDADRTDASCHTLSVAQQTNGKYRFLCYSTSLELIYGEDGAVVNIPMSASSNIESGVYEFLLSGIVLTYKNGTKVKPADYRGSIVVGDGGSVQSVKMYGTYTADVLADFTDALQNNTSIASFDMTEATAIDETGTLSTGNPNALYYVAEGNSLANENNVVVGDLCDKLSITDGFSFFASEPFTATETTYHRNIESDKWYTLCLPYEIASDESIRLYSIENVSQTDNETGCIIVKETNSVEANTPTLFKSVASSSISELRNSNVYVVATEGTTLRSTTTDNIYLQGSYIGSTVNSSDIEKGSLYYISSNKFWRAPDWVKVTPLRAYFVYSPTSTSYAVKSLSISTETETTGITSIRQEKNRFDTYDLSGRRIINPRSGTIYIQNGGKVVFK